MDSFATRKLKQTVTEEYLRVNTEYPEAAYREACENAALRAERTYNCVAKVTSARRDGGYDITLIYAHDASRDEMQRAQSSILHWVSEYGGS